MPPRPPMPPMPPARPPPCRPCPAAPTFGFAPGVAFAPPAPTAPLRSTPVKTSAADWPSCCIPAPMSEAAAVPPCPPPCRPPPCRPPPAWPVGCWPNPCWASAGREITQQARKATPARSVFASRTRKAFVPGRWGCMGPFATGREKTVRTWNLLYRTLWGRRGFGHGGGLPTPACPESPRPKRQFAWRANDPPANLSPPETVSGFSG